MTADKIVCAEGKVRPIRGAMGFSPNDTPHQVGKAFTNKVIKGHGTSSVAFGDAMNDLMDSARLSDKAFGIYEKFFAPTDPKTGKLLGVGAPHEFMYKYMRPSRVLQDYGNETQNIVAIIRNYTHDYLKQASNSRTDKSAFVKGLRPILTKITTDFNEAVPVSQARELVAQGKYTSVIDALLDIHPEADTRIEASRLIALKNTFDLYVENWLQGGDLFNFASPSAVGRIVNTVTANAVRHNPMIAVYNFHELFKGLPYAMEKTGDARKGIEAYMKTFKDIAGDGNFANIFNEKDSFAQEFGTLYSEQKPLVEGNGKVANSLQSLSDFMGKSDVMLRSFYYQLGKNLETASESAKVEAGKRSVADNIFIYDVADKPVYLSGDYGTLAYSMMRFVMGSTVQFNGYVRKAILHKSPESVMALATYMGLFGAIYGLEGTLTATPVAIVGQAVLGKEEWGKTAKLIDSSMPFLDLSDKLLTQVSKALGGDGVNAGYRASLITTPFLGVGLQRVNQLVKSLSTNNLKAIESFRDGDINTGTALVSNSFMSLLMFSPHYGSEFLRDIVGASAKTFEESYRGKLEGTFVWEDYLKHIEVTMFGDEA
jgi:hypothetical protein